MIDKPKIITILGTRPELIKLSQIIKELDKASNHFLAHTGQNFDYELNEIFYKDLSIRKPDFFFNSFANSAIKTISNILVSTEKLFKKITPDALIIYGDTNSCLSSYVAKKMHIPIFHLEAGNRSFDQNIPEETNRKLVDHLSDINMPLTSHARDYLLKEGIRGDSIIKIGSCMKEIILKNQKKINNSKILNKLKLSKNKFFVASIHREENVEKISNIKMILNNLNYVSENFNIPIILSTHPRTQKKIEKLKLKEKFKNIKFIKPLGFTDYISLQSKSLCVISDSGTIAEESSIIGFPAIMMRLNHERPEAFDQGVLVKSFGNKDNLVNSINYVVNTNPTSSKLIVNDYNELSVSIKVVRNILSYIDNVKSKYN
tara:strand:+ start:73 stop:1194 length:1122 start_codon:yes stop_codon:yes gene_type:complete